MTVARPEKSKQFYFCCNGAKFPRGKSGTVLEYRQDFPDRNVKLSLPRFAQSLGHIPDRILDLLEIASYVFSADRLASRGRRDAVEFHSWPRIFTFYIKVRDYAFWCRSDVQNALREALCFMTGDKDYQFHFFEGHETPKTSLFDQEGISVSLGSPWAVCLFSGGLDSLAGVIHLLRQNQNVLLVSHQSQVGTKRTQRQLTNALKRDYEGRVLPYKFECHLTRSQEEARAPEETQRTRAFLYCSIAFAVASVHHFDQAYIFENGVTSINLYRREDLANARASRTTHPRTIRLLKELFSLVIDRPFTFRLPFLFSTKRDVMEQLRDTAPELISSAVSCSQTFQLMNTSTHCGTCFQCIDRQFAAYSAGVTDYDHRGLYAEDIITQEIKERSTLECVLDYLRQAAKFYRWSIDQLYSEYLSEMADVVEALPQSIGDDEPAEAVWKLLHRHGCEVRESIKQMREQHDNPFAGLSRKCVLGIVNAREYIMDGEMVDFAIITALEEERDAVLHLLPSNTRLAASESSVRVGYAARLDADDNTAYDIRILPLLGMGRVEAANATTEAIRRWKPRCLMLVGIAGGVKERGVKLGDVLVADQVADYELQKLTPAGPEIRWRAYPASARLLAAAKALTEESWQLSIAAPRPARGKPSRHVGPVASGDKVVAAADVLQQYRKSWAALLGIEMEGGGVAAAAFTAPESIEFIMIRGVSDLADGAKNTTRVQKWRQYACDVAAAYAVSLIKSAPIPPRSGPK